MKLQARTTASRGMMLRARTSVVLGLALLAADLWVWRRINLLLVLYDTTKTTGPSTSSIRDNVESIRRLHRAIQIHETAVQAADAGYGNCGPDEQATSLAQTVARFEQTMSVVSEPNNSALFRRLMLSFAAVGKTGTLRTTGGDEFIVTLSAWYRGSGNINNNEQVTTDAYKVAVRTTDWMNGTYSVVVVLPNVHAPLQHYNFTLMHYYTCHQGYAFRPRKYDVFDLDFGPAQVTVVDHPQWNNDLLLGSSSSSTTGANDINTFFDRLAERKLCEPSQQGMDELTAGAWLERGVELDAELSVKAVWIPFSCQPPEGMDAKNSRAHRVGDSTMPISTLHVGNPYYHYGKFNRKFTHHKNWIHYLSNQLPEQLSSSEDLLILGSGLHQLYCTYNAVAVHHLVVRMLCQVAAIFPGKMVLMGAWPVQQQMYFKVDNTDQNVMWLNAVLRRRIHKADGKLERICEDVKLEHMYDDVNKQNGTSVGIEQATRAFEERGYNVSLQETKLIDWFQGLKVEQRHSVYGNRTVLFAELQDFLLPRAETYKDKLHLYFSTRPWRDEMIQRLLRMRQLAAE